MMSVDNMEIRNTFDKDLFQRILFASTASYFAIGLVSPLFMIIISGFGFVFGLAVTIMVSSLIMGFAGQYFQLFRFPFAEIMSGEDYPNKKQDTDALAKISSAMPFSFVTGLTWYLIFMASEVMTSAGGVLSFILGISAPFLSYVMLLILNHEKTPRDVALKGSYLFIGIFFFLMMAIPNPNAELIPVEGTPEPDYSDMPVQPAPPPDPFSY